MNMKEYAFGIDLGGTTAKVGLFTTAGAAVFRGTLFFLPYFAASTSTPT